MSAAGSTIAYVQDEPVKAMLIAAAGGAVLMGLIALLIRRRATDKKEPARGGLKVHFPRRPLESLLTPSR